LLRYDADKSAVKNLVGNVCFITSAVIGLCTLGVVFTLVGDNMDIKMGVISTEDDV